eukprot:6389157-Amphidinium_carterae.1
MLQGFLHVVVCPNFCIGPTATVPGVHAGWVAAAACAAEVEYPMATRGGFVCLPSLSQGVPLAPIDMLSVAESPLAFRARAECHPLRLHT